MKILCSSVATSLCVALCALAPQPNPDAPFSGGSLKKSTPELYVSGFHFGYRDKDNKPKKGNAEQPGFSLGNKEVAVRKINGRPMLGRDNSIHVYIDNKRALSISWAGVVPKIKKGGYPFFTGMLKEKLLIDRIKNVIRYERPYLLDASGKQAVFSYEIRAGENSKIIIDYDLGISQQEMDSREKKFNVNPWLSFFYRTPDDKFEFAGKVHKPKNPEEILNKKFSASGIKGPLKVSSGGEDGGFSISTPLTGHIEESAARLNDGTIRHTGFIWMTRPTGYPVKGQIILNLGVCRMRVTSLPPIGGIDFWGQDATHVVQSPVRNLWPNPSFEQGLRYWNWLGGGATYVPSADGSPRDKIISPGLFGKHALLIDSKGSQGAGMVSFPISLEKGQKYVFSFYARTSREKGSVANVIFASAASSGQFSLKGIFGIREVYPITGEWRRFSRKFTADYGGLKILLAGSDVMFDGLQLEKGETPSEFIAPPLEGMLLSADSDNYLEKGKKMNLKFRVTGEPGVAGKVVLSIYNAFRETLWSKSYSCRLESGEEILTPDWQPHPGDEGIFLMEAKYTVGGKTFFDFFRFSLFTPLENLHATKNIPGTLMHLARITRGADLARKMMEWGFGSSSWGINYRVPDHKKIHTRLEKKYRIDNIGMMINYKWNRSRSNPDDVFHWKEVTPEREKEIEEEAFRTVNEYDPEQYNVFTFFNEEEGIWLIRQEKYDEWAKAQIAAAKGVKRANPNAKTMPTMGTTGYNRMRGMTQMDGYLAAARKLGWKYDAIAVHTYGSLDKGTLSHSDLDEDLALLLSHMKIYGYGPETPVYITETGNTPETQVKEWDTISYDAYQSGKATYDFGLREFIHAASFFRSWIITLKYWPQVQSMNIWCARPYLDQYFTPILLCKAANTFGKFFPEVKFRADVKPSAKIRGYVFDLPDKTSVAALWCIDHDVENGLRKGPEVKVNFGQKFRIFDFMGTERLPSDVLKLTPAPLIIKAANGEKLAQTLQNMEIEDKQNILEISFQPSISGIIEARIKNMTGKTQKGLLEVAGQKLSYNVPGIQTQTLTLPATNAGATTGKMYHWNQQWNIPGIKSDFWEMDYFYVPYTKNEPNWNEIPAIQITNRYVSKGVRRDKHGKGIRDTNGKLNWVMPKAGYPGDLEAKFQLAWNEEYLYLRVEVEDDKYILFPNHWKKGKFAETQLYALDGCLEVYFDCGANGRTNVMKTYDSDDYRYDFSIGKSGQNGPGMVYRLREVDHQLADGINMPSKKEAAQKIRCDFQKTEKGYTYTIVFKQRYLDPLLLRSGSVAGFALYLHDKDEENPIGHKALSLATKPGSHCDYKPHEWPLMLLIK